MSPYKSHAGRSFAPAASLGIVVPRNLREVAFSRADLKRG